MYSARSRYSLNCRKQTNRVQSHKQCLAATRARTSVYTALKAYLCGDRLPCSGVLLIFQVCAEVVQGSFVLFQSSRIVLSSIRGNSFLNKFCNRLLLHRKLVSAAAHEWKVFAVCSCQSLRSAFQNIQQETRDQAVHCSIRLSSMSQNGNYHLATLKLLV